MKVLSEHLNNKQGRNISKEVGSGSRNNNEANFEFGEKGKSKKLNIFQGDEK